MRRRLCEEMCGLGFLQKCYLELKSGVSFSFLMNHQENLCNEFFYFKEIENKVSISKKNR